MHLARRPNNHPPLRTTHKGHVLVRSGLWTLSNPVQDGILSRDALAGLLALLESHGARSHKHALLRDLDPRVV